MNIDKSLLKRLVEQSKSNEILVLLINSLDKNSYKNYQKEIDSFVNKKDDYVMVLLKK